MLQMDVTAKLGKLNNGKYNNRLDFNLKNLRSNHEATYIEKGIGGEVYY